MDRGNFASLGPADRNALRRERTRRPALEGPRPVGDRKEQPGKRFLGQRRRQNLKIRLAEAIFALARPTQGWVEQSPAVPKFSYSMRMPFSPAKKYCAPKPVRKLVPLTWRPSLLTPLVKPLL